MKTRTRLGLVLLFLVTCGSAVVLHYYKRPLAEPPTHQALYAVVFDHVKAVRADDFGSAYLRASREVRQNLPLAQFREMARVEFPALLEARGVEFGTVQVRGARASVEVFFIGSDREVFPCIYSLIREKGAWKVDRVKMLPHWPAGLPLTGVRV